jgi:hypothetical protein
MYIISDVCEFILMNENILKIDTDSCPRKVVFCLILTEISGGKKRKKRRTPSFKSPTNRQLESKYKKIKDVEIQY